MKKLNNETFYTIGEVAKLINRGTQTIKNWYEYQDQSGETVLPEPRTDLDAKGTRYFKESDVEELIEFRDSVKYGMMSDVSRSKWGQRGKEIKKSKEEK